MEQVICDLQKITLQEISKQEILTQIEYNEYKITIFEQNDLVYFKAIDIAYVLKYTDTR